MKTARRSSSTLKALRSGNKFSQNINSRICIKAWLEDYHLTQQIKWLSDEERRAIIEKSPLEAGAFQGEGFHVFLKSEPDFSKAYVTSLGEITGEQAEDWIIRQYLRQEQNFKKYRTERNAKDWIRY